MGEFLGNILGKAEFAEKRRLDHAEADGVDAR